MKVIRSLIAPYDRATYPYIVIDAIDLTVTIAIKVASLLTTETNEVSEAEKSQNRNQINTPEIFD